MCLATICDIKFISCSLMCVPFYIYSMAISLVHPKIFYLLLILWLHIIYDNFFVHKDFVLPVRHVSLFCGKFLLWNTRSCSTYACLATYSWFFGHTISMKFFVVSLYGIFFYFLPSVHIVNLSRGTPLQRGGTSISVEVRIHISWITTFLFKWIYIFLWRVASFFTSHYRDKLHNQIFLSCPMILLIFTYTVSTFAFSLSFVATSC